MLDWITEDYSTLGYVGGIQLFEISSYRMDFHDPAYKMVTTLPGYARPYWKHDEEAALKALADKILAAWLAKVTGQADRRDAH